MRALTTATAAALLFAAGAAHAQTGGDMEQGEAKSLQCVACHGPQGMAVNPTFPHLAGQHAAYLQSQLMHFRTGQRYDPVMSPVAKSLTPEDIEDLAAYFSSVGPLADAP